MKQRKKKEKGIIWKKRKVVIKIPYCPTCGEQLEEETNADCRTLWHYRCDNINCDFKE